MTTPLRLLLVEDSMDDALLLVRELELGGYDVACERVETYQDMSEALDRQRWDVVIADYTMPKFSGTAALELVRNRSVDAPFIFVSGTIGEDAAVAAMKTGADDYIMKGNLKRLVPAVQRELRDAQSRSDRRSAEERLQYLAYSDPLTELPNRALLQDRLQQAVITSHRDGEPLSLLMLDLDRFKEVNDTLGHHIGDRLLHQVGQRMTMVLREADTAARFGGDEFAVILPGTNVSGATIAARKLLTAIERPFVIEGFDLDVRASIGIALANGQGTTANDMLRQADVAMFLAKDANSGYAIYTPEFDHHSPQRLALVSDLRQAIERRQLSLHYQPKVDLRTGHVFGTEALVRWQHPAHGLILPNRFIGLAEQIGFINPLTFFVLEQALTQCRRWRQAGQDVTVAVNLSAGSLQDGHLVDQLSDVIRACEADPSWLELEITESVVMNDPTRAMQILTRLHGMGLRLTIDDFGIGHSSLSYLKRLPVRGMKIDQSFVMEMARHDDVIVRSTIELAHNLGLQVVAEGVETHEIWSRLIVLGCDAAQGNYVSGPLEPQKVASWITEWESIWPRPRDPQQEPDWT
jgi:diguanylate cyclase (GGDEF)-like protein